MTQIEPAGITRFRSLVSARVGLYFDDSKFEFLENVLGESAADAGARSVDDFLARLSQLDVRDPQFQCLVERLTVGETYFFRNPDHYRALECQVIPDCARSGGAIRIVSAGCATGEEPHSVAILLRKLFPAISPAHVTIDAIDINASSLVRARKGVYSAWALRATSDALKQRWFRPDGKNFVIGEPIRDAVRFETRNLIDAAPEFWAPQSIDVLFCCNVTMYFAASTTKALIARFAHAIRPGGYLFMGHAESLRGLTQDFELRHMHDTFYYQRRPASERSSGAQSGSSSHWRCVSEATATAADGSWVEVIRRTSARIEQLAQPLDAPVVTPQIPPPTAAAPDLAAILKLVSEERFAAALRALDELPKSRRAEIDARLIHAVILTNAGDLMQAQQACSEILELDEQQPGAHYLLGVCSEHAGDCAAARENHRAAIYFDPEFAMSHLRIGVLARRSRDWNEARRELVWAERLLATEDAGRLLLYGSGFGREALIALCRSELRALGARHA